MSVEQVCRYKRSHMKDNAMSKRHRETTKDHHAPLHETVVNTYAPEGYAVPTTHVPPFVLPLSHTR